MSIFRYALKETKKELRKEAHGEQGEQAVQYTLEQLLPKEGNYRFFNDVIIKDSNTMTHQLDHIVICNNGIFVIETKNIRGKISGNPNERKWVQTIDDEEYGFLNPLIQNESHVHALNELLNNKYSICSLVVFVRNNVRNLNIPNVVNINNLTNYLSNYVTTTPLTDEEVISIYNDLKTKLTNQPSKIEHIANIRIIQNKIARGVCPKCDSNLTWVEKDGIKKAVCSNPNCRFEVKQY